MMGFIGGHDARVWENRPASERRTAALQNLANYFGDEALNPREVVEFNWSHRGLEPRLPGRGARARDADRLRAGAARRRSAASTGPAPRPRPTGTATWTARCARASGPRNEVLAALNEVQGLS